MIELMSKHFAIKRPAKCVRQHADEQCKHHRVGMAALAHVVGNSILRRALCQSFSTFWSPEYHPCSKVLGKVLEPMLNVGAYKEAIPRAERVASPVNNELAGALMDEIDFVLIMRRLWIAVDRSVILHGHGAMGKRDGKTFSHRPLRGYRAGNARKHLVYRRFDFQVETPE